MTWIECKEKPDYPDEQWMLIMGPKHKDGFYRCYGPIKTFHQVDWTRVTFFLPIPEPPLFNEFDAYLNSSLKN